jgi:ribosomal protein L37AE/L43A
MVTKEIIAPKEQEKQDICPVCGLNQKVFREMFGIADDEPTGCEQHNEPCPFCSKRAVEA